MTKRVDTGANTPRRASSPRHEFRAGRHAEQQREKKHAAFGKSGDLEKRTLTRTPETPRDGDGNNPI